MFVIAFLIYILPFTFACMRTPEIPGPPIPLPTTTTIDPCPIPPGTAMLFISNGVVLFDANFGKVDAEQSCKTQTGMNDWYPGDTPEIVDQNVGGAAGSWDRTNCAAPCICTAAGACYMPADPTSQDPSITFYPHCPTPTTCFIAVYLASDGQLVTVPPGGPGFSSDDQLNEDADFKPVTDPGYLKAKSVGCNGCPVITL